MQSHKRLLGIGTMVKRSITVGILGCLLLVSAGCIFKKSNTHVVPMKPTTTTPAKATFIPPPDSAITVEQMRSWLACNHLLDSLSYLYQDSFKTEDPARRLTYQDDFIKAQDKICIRCGLGGGYTEYAWILNNAGSARNKAILDSVGMASY